MAKNWIFDSDFSFSDEKFSRIYRLARDKNEI